MRSEVAERSVTLAAQALKLRNHEWQSLPCCKIPVEFVNA